MKSKNYFLNIMKWSKNTLILTGEKYFGQGSINIINIAGVQCIVKFPFVNPSKTAFGSTRFLRLQIRKIQSLSRTVKNRADLERRVDAYK